MHYCYSRQRYENGAPFWRTVIGSIVIHVTGTSGKFTASMISDPFRTIVVPGHKRVYYRTRDLAVAAGLNTAKKEGLL